MNRFFKTDDERLDVLGNFKIPKEWWSRPYEYAFANKYLNKDHIILDAGCGIEHPFKWFAMDKVKTVLAVDKDERINEFSGDPNISYYNINMIDIPKYIDNVDAIFCLSVLEHLKPLEQHKTFEAFSKVLKKGSKVYLTVDYPLLDPHLLKEMAKHYFEVPKTQYKESDKDLYNKMYNLKVYSMILIRK